MALIVDGVEYIMIRERLKLPFDGKFPISIISKFQHKREWIPTHKILCSKTFHRLFIIKRVKSASTMSALICWSALKATATNIFVINFYAGAFNTSPEIFSWKQKSSKLSSHRLVRESQSVRLPKAVSEFNFTSRALCFRALEWPVLLCLVNLATYRIGRRYLMKASPPECQ